MVFCPVKYMMGIRPKPWYSIGRLNQVGGTKCKQVSTFAMYPTCIVLLVCFFQVGEDPFTQLREEKRERIKGQQQRQLANVKLAAKTGALPPTLKLAAKLQERGKGKHHKRKELKDEVSWGWLYSMLMLAYSLTSMPIGVLFYAIRGTSQHGLQVLVVTEKPCLVMLCSPPPVMDGLAS
jgi:hypothetical protein